MEAEFGTVAEWTAQVAADLGPEYHIPAACRGSGSPAALDWLIDRMALTSGTVLLDCGAGVGGPAAYAARSREVLPILVEPELSACRASRRLFDYPVVCAQASGVPLADSSVDAAWSLGVLCTTQAQLELLKELRRTVRPGGYIGLLVFVAHRAIPRDLLQDNEFPTTDGLLDLIHEASLHVHQRHGTADLPPIPDTWTEYAETISTTLTDRHGHERAWELAENQSETIGRLLEEGTLTGELLVVRGTSADVPIGGR
jgi:SAM-dependent methyltransferase